MATIASPDQHDPIDRHPQSDGAHALKEVLAGIERDLILTALQQSRGNKAQAARALGITERLMGLRVKRLGIDWRALRRSGRASDAR
jgi:Nif-specific regulatory protein